ncbi:uncharacterized protein LOC143284778 isoform X2 [Babylonia areolata]|uniref:uncharacterized protein LOC143284778 isoform X2 n=1 Tax=Babylonia areolata TaxID=304850 RepID=UPI003FD43F5D
MGQEFSVADLQDMLPHRPVGLRLDDALEQFLNTVGSKVKVGRRAEVHRRAVYQCRRMRCGAPSVTRNSFSEEDLLRFERENDGFPIAANEEQIRDFESEVFSGDSRVPAAVAGDEVERKSRSKSLAEVVALAKLLKLPRVPSPTKPKFLDRLITSRGVSNKKCSENRAGKKRGRRLLSSQDSPADRWDQSEEEEEADFVSSGSTDNEGATGYLLLQDPEDCGEGAEGRSHGVTSIHSEPCSPVLEREKTFRDSDGDVASPPLSPILSGLVKQRCESYKRHQESVGGSVKGHGVERARSQDRGCCDSPRARRCFSPVTEKADRWIKGYYSLSRDESFSKAVMEKGYVRALAQQINSGTLPPAQADEEEDQMGKDEEREDDSHELKQGGSSTAENNGQNEGEQEEEEIKCVCPKACLPHGRNQGGPAKSQSASHSNMSAGAESGSQVRHNSMIPCHLACCVKGDNTVAKEKRTWSPRERRKHSGRPRSPPPAIPTAKVKPMQDLATSSQPLSKCSSPEPHPPVSPDSPQSKPPVNHSTKPKVTTPKPSQASTMNGDTRKSPESTDAPSAAQRSRSPLQDKGLPREESDVSSSAVYDNVFYPPINPHELFDMSWSDSESDEFTDSEEDSVTAQHNKELGDVPPSTPKDKLHQIALELLTTERAYVQRLSLLHNVFYFRIDQENRTHGFLPGDTLTQMFSSIQSIHQFHNDFLLKEVEERMKNWESERRIGDLMRKNAPFLKLYTAYVKNFDNAMNLINYWLDKSQKFAAIVAEIQKMPESGSLTLQHHMLGPIQRVPRYELLLKDYLKNLPGDSPDRPDAQAALDLVTTAAMHSNEAMKKIEKFHRLLDIYQRLRGVAVDFISPTRDFVREGPITKISARSGEKQSRYLFLFNDLLLICSEPLVGAYRVRAQLDVDGMEVKQGDNLAIPNTFLVHSKQKAIELLEEQPAGSGSTWLESLKQVIEDLRSKKWSFTALNSPTEQESTPGKQAPRWIPDDAVTMCMICEMAFTTFRRRHHCRACGKLICKNCCKKAPLEYMNNRLERVCLECHDAIVFSGKGAVQSPARTGKRRILQVKADDPGLLAGYLSISDDAGKTWNKRWFTLHEDFVMYFFKARQDVSAYNSLPLPGYQVESLADPSKPYTLRVYHHSINTKGILFQADNDKILKKWANMLSKLVLAQLPDESQRLSSQSNSSSASSGSDNNTAMNNNNNTTTTTTTTTTTATNSDKLSQADSCFTASDSICEDSVTESPTTTGDEVNDDSVIEKL